MPLLGRDPVTEASPQGPLRRDETPHFDDVLGLVIDAEIRRKVHPERIAPALHMWTGSQVSWLKIDDKLPRHEGQA